MLYILLFCLMDCSLTTPCVTELRLQSCLNLSAFSLLHVFLCVRPCQLQVLDLTGIPGLTEKSAVLIATSCVGLELLDLSGFWGPLLCLMCVQKIISGCPKLIWFDLCPYIPHSPVWEDLLCEHGGIDNRRIHFGPYIERVVAAHRDVD